MDTLDLTKNGVAIRLVNIVGWVVGIGWIAVCSYLIGLLLHGGGPWLALMCFLAWVPMTWPMNKKE